MGHFKRHDLAEAEAAALLAELRVWRQRCIEISTRAPISGALYQSMGGVLQSIDGVAEALTGDREALRDKRHSIP